jgi:hypothetical protein
MPEKPFSQELESWLKTSKNKTLAEVSDVFAERSFAIIILVLMAIPATPLPTGGLTHVFEIIAAILALEMIFGRRTIWLPEKWKQRQLGNMLEDKAIPFIVRRIRWFERLSRPRWARIVSHRQFARLAGTILLIFSVAAFMAPPFTGLDTLPSLGAVIVSLSLLLGDIVVFIIGSLVGAIGIGLIFVLGEAALSTIKHFF